STNLPIIGVFASCGEKNLPISGNEALDYPLIQKKRTAEYKGINKLHDIVILQPNTKKKLIKRFRNFMCRVRPLRTPAVVGLNPLPSIPVRDSFDNMPECLQTRLQDTMHSAKLTNQKNFHSCKTSHQSGIQMLLRIFPKL